VTYITYITKINPDQLFVKPHGFSSQFSLYVIVTD
jgi:hypothetical protein